MTNREQFLTAMSGGTPDDVPCFFNCAQINISWDFGDIPKFGLKGGYDGYGCYQSATESAAGNFTPDPAYPPAITDITQWKEQAVFPDFSKIDFAAVYENMKSMMHWDRKNFVQDYFCANGMFERLHFNMGFENAMVAIMTEPEAVSDYAGAIADKKIEQIELVAKYFKPDIFTYLDDFSHVNGLFISPETYRKIFKPHHQRIVDAVKANGMLFKQHCCGKFQGLFDDFYDIGIRMFDPCQPVNDIQELKRRHPGNVGFMGGLDIQHVIDKPDVTEEEIRAEVRRCIDSYGPGGGYVIYGATIDLYNPDSFAPGQKMGILIDEATKYGKNYYHRNQ